MNLFLAPQYVLWFFSVAFEQTLLVDEISLVEGKKWPITRQKCRMDLALQKINRRLYKRLTINFGYNFIGTAFSAQGKVRSIANLSRSQRLLGSVVTRTLMCLSSLK